MNNRIFTLIRAMADWTEALPPYPGTLVLRHLAQQASAAASRHLACVGSRAESTPPSITAAGLAALCGLSKSQIAYRLLHGDLPAGAMVGNRRKWPFDQARVWTRALRPAEMRPGEAAAVTLTVVRPGDSSETALTAATLAQAFCLHGHRVLLIDLDPRARTTSCFGRLPAVDVPASQTALSLLATMGPDRLRQLVQRCGWSGLDLVCSTPALGQAEMLVTNPPRSRASSELWRWLDRELDEVRTSSDLIVLDAPLGWSNLMSNALVASDGVLLAIQASAEELASAAEFCGQLAMLSEQVRQAQGQPKNFEFVDVLLTHDPAQPGSLAVSPWHVEAFGDGRIAGAVPSLVVGEATPRTIYDERASDQIDSRTLAQASMSWHRVCVHLERRFAGIWNQQVLTPAWAQPSRHAVSHLD